MDEKQNLVLATESFEELKPLSFINIDTKEPYKCSCGCSYFWYENTEKGGSLSDNGIDIVSCYSIDCNKRYFFPRTWIVVDIMEN